MLLSPTLDSCCRRCPIQYTYSRVGAMAQQPPNDHTSSGNNAPLHASWPFKNSHRYHPVSHYSCVILSLPQCCSTRDLANNTADGGASSLLYYLLQKLPNPPTSPTTSQNETGEVLYYAIAIVVSSVVPENVVPIFGGWWSSTFSLRVISRLVCS